jgi:hypothetical protein
MITLNKSLFERGIQEDLVSNCHFPSSHQIVNMLRNRTGHRVVGRPFTNHGKAKRSAQREKEEESQTAFHAMY